jgi:molybdate transport system regulatory protein
MTATDHHLKIKLQVYCGDEIAMGPGKADLLDAIAQHGSISAAARALGMSYRRAWLLVDAMNRCWLTPLVETSPGASSGGARLSSLGAEVLRHYRALQAAVDGACSGSPWMKIEQQLMARPRARQTVPASG